MAETKKPRVSQAAAASPQPTDGAAESTPVPLASFISSLDRAAVVDAAFKDDAKVQKTLSRNVKVRAKRAAAIAAKADAAFKSFEPSRYPKRERDARTYLAPGENLATALDGVVKHGVDAMRARKSKRAIRIRPTEELRGFIKKTDGDGGLGSITVGTVFNIFNGKFPAAPALRDEPAYTVCAAEAEALRRLEEIEGPATPAPTSTSPAATTPAPTAPAPTTPAPTTPAATSPTPASNGHGNGTAADAKALVAEHVHDLMATAPTPEEQPVLVASARSDSKAVKQALDGLKLRAGPSDVTSYHDFNSLQIAFEHVWAEVFDNRLGELGKDLYHAYVELSQATGYDPLKDEAKDPTKPTSVTSLEDIRQLMAHARQLGKVTDSSTPIQTLPADFEKLFSQAQADLTSLAAHLSPPFPADQAEAIRTVASIMAPLHSGIVQAQGASPLGNELDSVTRLRKLLESLDNLLKANYSFTVFNEKAINFGMMVTYRQTWTPEQYQVGDLVKTIPLAPKETRRYTTKQVTKKSRTAKEVEDNLRAGKSGWDDTARADREIVDRAQKNTNFKVTADGSFGTEANKIHATAEAGGDDSAFSQATKKNFHEAVLKSAQEYKHENRMEVETVESTETESTTVHELQNPNDELTVTYLFYELQRTYHVREKLHQVTPVILVANAVPAPHEIDDAWLVEHDWILRRVLLDDSFRPALDYLTQSFVGDELNLQILDNNVLAQRQVVEAIKAQVAAQISVVERAQHDLATKIDAKSGLQIAEGVLGTVKRVFDPFKLTGGDVTGTSQGMDTVADFAQESLDRAEREKLLLLDQLGAGMSALQIAVDKLSAATKDHFNRVTEIDRLRVHVKENILYYMQAIWNHEPPDQRYFRTFSITAPIVELKSTGANVALAKTDDRVDGITSKTPALQAQLPLGDFEIKWKPLVEIADLDEVLGYKGNYAVYRLKENNYLTLHMMQNYLELSDEVQLRDPDDVANYTVSELQSLAKCLRKQNKTTYESHRKEIKQMIIDRLMSGRAEDDRVIVPTKSLYVEALVGTHPLLEEFKLLHRALDVKKVQAEVRHAELENVRLAARALKGKDDDPDIEKKIVVEQAAVGQVVIDPNGD